MSLFAQLVRILGDPEIARRQTVLGLGHGQSHLRNRKSAFSLESTLHIPSEGSRIYTSSELSAACETAPPSSSGRAERVFWYCSSRVRGRSVLFGLLSMASPYAFVTLLTSDAYLPGALTLAAALRDVHPSPPTPPEVDFQTVCLVTPESVDVSSIKLLRRAFNLVIGVEIIEEDNARGLQLLGRPDLHSVLTKLHVFRLIQFSKIIFLDADILPTRPLSHLFSLPHPFAAVPDVGWPDIFNSGMMVLTPGQREFDQLLDLAKTKGSWDGGDQGLLNEWRGNDWHRLSFTYNTTPTAAYTYAPAFERFGSQISAIHFIGPNKPWNSIPWRAPASTETQENTSDPLQAYHYGALVDRWYAVYDKHYRSVPVVPEAEYVSRRYESVWDERNTGLGVTVISSPVKTAMSLEDLRRITVEGFSGSAAPSFSHPGEADYIRLPLDGRLDLMRPRPESQPEPEANAGAESRQAHPLASGSSGDGTPRADSRMGYFADVGSAPSTPVARSRALPGETPPRMHTLPTPGPDELPPAPYHAPLSLPPTPGSPTPRTYNNQQGGAPPQLHQPGGGSSQQYQAAGGFSQQYQAGGGGSQPYQSSGGSPQVYQSAAGSQPGYNVTQQASSTTFSQGPPSHQAQSDGQSAGGQHEQQQQQQGYSAQTQHYEAPKPPPRPPSPPMVIWNPAVEGPPSTAPPSNFPSDTYFRNVWDESKDSQPGHGDTSAPLVSSVLFALPPPSQIPQRLLHEGHYSNVLGERRDAAPEPDPAKVKAIFPWEEKPRHAPGRHFPVTDAPPPGVFIQPAPEPSPSPSPPLLTPLSPLRPYVPPPQVGLPTSFTYTNAWDSVPSIQRYASKLVRPQHPAAPLAPAFDIAESRKRENKLFTEAYESEQSSQDGDDEDTEPEEAREEQRRRSRSTSGATFIGKGKKEYRTFGVQTIPKQTRNQGVQVNLLGLPPGADWTGKGKTPTGTPSRTRPANGVSAPLQGKGEGLNVTTAPEQYTPSHMSTSIVSQTNKLSPLASPTGLRSPRMYSPRGSSVNLAATMTSPSKPTPLRTAPDPKSAIYRTISSDTASSPSSAGPPASPKDTPKDAPVTPSTPARKVSGRVWDPARGVDIFKRGSEEVLARFLRMGSWEEEAGAQR
ncbi:hypothetical protein EVG20_g204 [Dentipellis fragilis]|uniref:glycogenin glucosyltransferase n=1 Tax=Dentipellis fragilis TaxID=205917 RepID=A0A4Y9ZDX4_9AGAM|nr:hypothetical protein EVG20_g204 [Dentipellis fragilis]